MDQVSPITNTVGPNQQQSLSNSQHSTAQDSNKEDQSQAVQTILANHSINEQKVLSDATPANSSVKAISPSSNSSTTSGQSAAKAETTAKQQLTKAKFKEKRPEPLKLDPVILKQDIPLDLSVKSAGYIPSEANIFNLMNANQFTTLETPRIAWQDNETSMLKNRLYSSSNNACQRLRLSTFIGDSPPTTPGTSFLDILYSPTFRSAGFLQSASFMHDSNTSLQSLMSAQITPEFHHTRFEDVLLSDKSNNKSFSRYNFKGNEIFNAPKRSSSIDNLSALGNNNGYHLSKIFTNQQSHTDGKPSSFSPSPLIGVSNKMSDRFSYPIRPTNLDNQSTIARNDVNKSNIHNISGDNDTLLISGNQTPTCVANATKNLLNTHLNSPTNAQGPSITDATNQHSIESNLNNSTTCNKVLSDNRISTDQDRDSIISSSQQFINQRSPLNESTSMVGSNSEKNPSSFFHLNPPVATTSGATLNTPTLVSPNQLKTCFLPSPTLSPLSSVFKLSSPLLMFPPQVKTYQADSDSFDQRSKSNIFVRDATEVKITQGCTGKKRQGEKSITSFFSNPISVKSCSDVNLTDQETLNRQTASSEANLVYLVTPAAEKIGFDVMEDYISESDVKMDTESRVSIFEDTNSLSKKPEPLHLAKQIREEQDGGFVNMVPRILVSDCPDLNLRHQSHSNLNHEDMIQQRENQRPPEPVDPKAEQGDEVGDCSSFQYDKSIRDSIEKRPLSPQSLKLKNISYYKERLESSSAPPDVHENPMRSKMKSETVSQIDLAPESNSNDSCSRPVSQPLQCSPHVINSGNHYKFNSTYSEIQNSKQINQSSLDDRSGVSYYGSRLIESHTNYPPTGQHYGLDQQIQPNNHNFLNQHFNGYELSTIGHNFAQSAQQLHANSLQSKVPLITSHQPCQSMSVDGLNMMQNPSRAAPSIFTLSSQPNILHEQQQIDQYQQISLDHRINTSQSVILEQVNPSRNDLNGRTQHQSRADHNEHFSLNHITQGQMMRFQSINHLQSQPRSLSADLRGLSHSESSCNSADFCLRPRSAASGSTAKKYHCDQCSKSFTRSDMLTRHRRLHSGDRPFQCNECKQEFSRSDHLSTHLRTHTGEKPYKCKLCPYSACRKDMITRHMKVHNRNSPNSRRSDLG